MTLRAWMEANGKSAAQVAKGSEVPASTICRYLKGRNPLSAKNIARLVSWTNGDVSFGDLTKEGRRLTKKRRDDLAAVSP